MSAKIFFLLGCGLVGTALTFGAGMTLIQAWQVQSWEAVDAQVSSVRLERLHQSNEDEQFYRLHATYHYQFNGVDRASSRVFISPTFGLDTREAAQKELFEKLEHSRVNGQPVVAYVDPRHSTRAVLVRDLHYPFLLAILVAGLFAAATGWMCLAALALARNAPSRSSAQRRPARLATSGFDDRAIISSHRDSPFMPAFLLLIANAVVIGVTLRQGWPLESLLLIYWVQSVFIWISNDIRLMLIPSAKLESVITVQVGNRIIEDPTRIRILGTMGSILLFGSFHMLHLVGIVMLFDINWLPDQAFWLAVGALLAAQAWTLLDAVMADRRPGTVARMGYGSIFARIAVIHLVVVFGAWWSESTTGVIFFLLLKTAADVFLQMRQQR
jgi:hypothetical protein